MAFLLGNAPFHHQTHTPPLPSAKFDRLSRELQPSRVGVRVAQGTLVGVCPQPVLPVKGSRGTSVVSLRTFANSSSLPVVVFVDMQPEYLATPPLPPLSHLASSLPHPR